MIFDRNVPSGLARWMISRLPLTFTPLTSVLLPRLTSCAPTISVPFGSVMNCAPGEPRSWFATRLIAYLKLDAVTRVPSLKRKPFRMKKVYVVPPFDTLNLDATSGTSLAPFGPLRSGKL